ncbi:hypothetical protein ACFVIM_29195 [Streptomyces sp. NPDC057638]|uniref:helix-hairpin-helix domain-containing protein n=1 Tax=Streptomyces sp. NPDC057638 TaxID=3346190 RepID=UPI0036C4EE4B
MLQSDGNESVTESVTAFAAVGADVRSGLGSVGDVGDHVIDAIVGTRRRKGKFTSLADSLGAVDPPARSVHADLFARPGVAPLAHPPCDQGGDRGGEPLTRPGRRGLAGTRPGEGQGWAGWGPWRMNISVRLRHDPWWCGCRSIRWKPRSRPTRATRWRATAIWRCAAPGSECSPRTPRRRPSGGWWSR